MGATAFLACVNAALLTPVKSHQIEGVSSKIIRFHVSPYFSAREIILLQSAVFVTNERQFNLKKTIAWKAQNTAVKKSKTESDDEKSRWTCLE